MAEWPKKTHVFMAANEKLMNENVEEEGWECNNRKSNGNKVYDEMVIRRDDELRIIRYKKRCRRSSYSMERMFKGVVAQPNGNWGAQIYANHHRIWLGTFKSEIDAAMAYDTAAIKLRSGDSQRNFELNIHEPKFLTYFSTEAVLNMIRDGSYPTKFADFLLNMTTTSTDKSGESNGSELILLSSVLCANGEYSCTLLFDKELTPRDVGKLNRLVIPKRYAVKHFPKSCKKNNNEDDDDDEEVEVELYDTQMRLWRFRYCYWKSSQSFVFTRGWNGFVKDKGLRAKDTISFYMYERPRRSFNGQAFLLIDSTTNYKDGHDHNEQKQDHPPPPTDKKSEGFRLFGVQLN